MQMQPPNMIILIRCNDFGRRGCKRDFKRIDFINFSPHRPHNEHQFDRNMHFDSQHILFIIQSEKFFSLLVNTRHNHIVFEFFEWLIDLELSWLLFYFGEFWWTFSI